MPNDINLNELVINKLTKEQYTTMKEAGTISNTELYLVSDSSESTSLVEAKDVYVSSETAAALGLQGDPTVDDALGKLKESVDGVVTVGKLVIEKITRSTTWIAPKAVSQIFRVFAVGGGGNGGYGTSSSYGGGGGGGGYIEVADLTIAEGTEIEVICGAGGAGIDNGNGLDGGSTSFGDYLTADGGKGGGDSSSGGTAYGGAGGAGGGGGFVSGSLAANGGAGGTYGGGGGGGYSGSGGAGGTYGGGGGGGSNSGSGGAGGTYGGAGGERHTVGEDGTFIDIDIVKDALLISTALSSGDAHGGSCYSANLGGGGGGGGVAGGHGGNANLYSTSGGGGGGGYGGHGGNSGYTNVSIYGGGGGGGYGGHGGFGTYGGGGGGGFFCNGGNGYYGGGGGGGFFSDGRGWSIGEAGASASYPGGDGGVAIVYFREEA